MAPYRSRPHEKPAVAPTTGLVADMVRQFADPYAFLRELVQNGIDAGATALEVRVEWEPSEILRTVVTDDGCGMSPEIMEGPLLTLFSSSKEGDLTKIGKYGVGFVSVFALAPDEVEVSSWRDGRACLLRLHPDHRYSIEEAPSRAGSGTAVALRKRMATSSFSLHVEQVRGALERWCRHAERPITLSVAGTLGGAAARVDVPFAVRAPLSVTATSDGDTFVVGPSAGAGLLPEPPPGSAAELEYGETFAGFYNRGLTLFETSEALLPGLRGIRFKVKSPALQHTLSRDNVRRDEAFTRVIERARQIVGAELRTALVGRLAAAAALAARGEAVLAYAALLETATSPPLSLEPRELTFPLTDPIKGVMALTDLVQRSPGRARPLLSMAPDAVTGALAVAGRPVVHVVHPVVGDGLRRCYPTLVLEEAQRAWVLVRELTLGEQGPADRALASWIQRVIAAAGEEVGRVALGEVEGAPHRAAVAVPDERPPNHLRRLFSVAELEASSRRFSGKQRLLLNVQSEAVRHARKIAERDPALAGQLLGRAILVEGRGPLDPGENARLIELAGERAP